ncbi:MAG: ANTAR domain-containing protein [Candidatus Omnitrophota bacterium]|jgi:signal transduction protein with GAF and PtsI domain|nr:ANTAR domain-containing protein [Candidatus Omnitrophota bacterium]|tara:strand:+ start:161 stop:883 length:723 start_codon:yes stop_codon:yes gene_type:complete
MTVKKIQKKKTIKSTSTIEALTKISKAISSDLYLEDILKLIVTVTAEVMNSRICTLMLLDDKKENLAIRATQSISEEYVHKKPLAKGEGVAWKVVETNKAIAILDVLKDAGYKYKDIAGKEKLVSLLCVPLAVKNKIIGVLNCYTSKPHKFTKTEINVLTSVANQAAISIENTELMVKTMVIQEELETRKVVERAKGLLMKEEGITESDAFRKIQKYSMDRRKPMKEVAEAIILMNEMKK